MTTLVAREITPVRIHVKEQPGMWRRFAIRWTPTVLVLARDGREVHRIEGFLPEDDFLAQLELGLAYVAVRQKDWETAERRFAAIVEEHPDTDAAPEALYWVGVSRYSASRDAAPLAETARWFDERYQDTSWAKRASVWRK